MESVDRTLEREDFNFECMNRIVKHAISGHGRGDLRLCLAGNDHYIGKHLMVFLNLELPTRARFKTGRDLRSRHSNRLEPIGVPNYMPGDQLCKRRDGPDNSRRTPPHCEAVKLQKRTRFRFRVEYQTVEKGDFMQVIA